MFVPMIMPNPAPRTRCCPQGDGASQHVDLTRIYVEPRPRGAPPEAVSAEQGALLRAVVGAAVVFNFVGVGFLENALTCPVGQRLQLIAR